MSVELGPLLEVGGDVEPESVTLLELVSALAEITADDREVVATVAYLLQTGRVRLRGIFCNTPIETLC